MNKIKVCNFIAACYFVALHGHCQAQITTIKYGDTAYMDRFIILATNAYEDSVSYVLKPALPDENYIVVSANTTDTFMIVTDTVSNYYSNLGKLESQSLKHNGRYCGSITYSVGYFNNTNHKRIILRHPDFCKCTVDYWFDFDENWKLLSCYVTADSTTQFAFDMGELKSFGAYHDGKKDGAWLVMDHGTATGVEVYSDSSLIYAVPIKASE